MPNTLTDSLNALGSAACKQCAYVTPAMPISNLISPMALHKQQTKHEGFRITHA